MRTFLQLAPTNDNLDHRTTNGWTVVSVTAEMDICCSEPIRQTVARLVDEGHRHFVLDLFGVTFLDSMGLGAIVAITKLLRAHAGSLVLARADARILTVFKAGGLHAVYAFNDSVEGATRHAPDGSGLDGWPYVRA
ncbi:STAS domain-containing protein [Streptomyces sp. NPDC056161]|uniref:STAS domain-containing protein n=1 Tax=Streptomyces sp. NPDC056161 TaxID=3345732 RepID=UPI0035E03CA5